MKNQFLIVCMTFFSIYAWGQPTLEDCANGLDDDGDGFIDLNDSDCKCKGIKDTLFVPSSLIPNPSFEDFNCCPSGLAQLFCSKSWIQASSATSDYFHTCGFRQDPMRGSPPLPLPAGNGYVGFLDLQTHPARNATYKEYVGACLTSTMLAGKDYTLSFWIGFGNPGNSYGPRFSTTLGIYGTSACGNLPFGGNNGWLCPTAYPNWFELTRVTTSGSKKWVKVTVKLKPTRTVEAIVVGPQCTRADGQYYYFIDDLILEESAKFDSIYLGIQGNPCIDSVQLSSPPTKITRIKYQWYFNGAAIPGAVTQNFQIPKGQEGRYTLRASDGADCELSNVYTYNIDTLSSFLTQQICFGESIKIGTNVFDKTGIYRVVIPSVFGCDSIVHLDLTVNTPGQALLDTSICENQVIDIQGVSYDSTGEYQIISQTAQGCDSLSILKLNVVKPIQTITEASICEGEVYRIALDSFTVSGDYPLLYKSQFGCDSTMTLHLLVNKPISQVIDTSICQGQSIQSGGVLYDVAGNYALHLKKADGCDSLVTLNLNMKPIYFTKIDTSFCEGNQIQIGNNIYNNTGNYFLSLNSFQGCDSNFQISLNVFPTHQLQFDTAICEGESLNIGSTTFYQTGNYTVISKNQFGCDSIFKLGLTVHSKSFTNVDTTFCDGGKLRLGGIDYTQAGTYDQSYVNRYQCDSLVRIHLIQNQTYQTIIDTAICSGNSFLFNNIVRNSTGIYRADLKSNFGCDSSIVLNLDVKPVYNTNIDTVICFNGSIAINGNTIDRDTLFQQHYFAMNGCDSVIKVSIKKSLIPNIEIEKKDISCFGLSDGFIQLQVKGNANPYTFKWSDGNSNSSRVRLSAGLYKYTVFDNRNCFIEHEVLLNSPSPLLLEIETKDANCLEPENGKLLINNLQGGIKPYSLTIDGQSRPVINVEEIISIGKHQIILRDSNGCEQIENLQIDPPFRGSTSLNPDSLSVILGDSVWLELFVRDIDSIISIIWTGPGIITCKNCLRTSAFITQEQGVFKVMITDVNGCVYESSVFVQSKQNYYVPNVFTPNGDAINDYFNMFADRSIDNIDILRIYDRWGNQVYESKNFPPNGNEGAWNGEINNQKALPGVYVFLFLFKDKVGRSHKLSGDLTLLR
ncbi:MAG: gliding motility-associated C-terminal domain-containing protein [Saprospiraceae bacterium]